MIYFDWELTHYHCSPGCGGNIPCVYSHIYVLHLQILYTFPVCVATFQVWYVNYNKDYSSTIIKQSCFSGIEMKLTFSLLLFTTKGANCARWKTNIKWTNKPNFQASLSFLLTQHRHSTHGSRGSNPIMEVLFLWEHKLGSLLLPSYLNSEFWLLYEAYIMQG